jgi:RecB family endonuclease NucS
MAMKDERNWVGLLTHFKYEKALSEFIAAYPNRLEDGLLPHPDKKVREKVFKDKTRSDVLLIDRADAPVIVECKQGHPTLNNLKQIRGYMNHLREETDKMPRGILVHGGARKLSSEISAAARKRPRIEIVRYSLDVDFASCA